MTNTAAATVENSTAVKAHKRQLRKAGNTTMAQAIAAAVQPGPAPTESTLVMELVNHTGETFIPRHSKDGRVQGSPDKLADIGIRERELPMLSHEQAVTLLRQNDRASLSVTAACATLISDWLISTPHAVAASTDGKAWKLVKAACEAHLIGIEVADANGIRFIFPQVWENYFSSCKKYLSLGGSPASLIYRNALDADCVRSVRWIKSECSRLDTTPPATKSERMEGTIISMVEAAFGGPEGKGEVVSPGDIHLPQLEAQFLLDVAEANLGTQFCRSRLESEDVEQTIRRLIAQHGGDMVRRLVTEYVQENPHIADCDPGV